MRKKIGILVTILLVMIVWGNSTLAYNTGDDYPSKYKNAATGTVADEWNFYNRNCTSFVAWCLNSRNGVAFTNQYKGASRWGNAITWGTVAKNVGITVDKTPAVGAVAWWNTGTYGHVAWVKKVTGSNITIEEYNWSTVGGYGERTIASSSVTGGFIHIKDISSYTSVPSTPTIKNVSVSGSNVTVSWNAVEQAEKYVVDFWDPNGSHNYFSATGTSYTKSLSDGYYGIRVCAENSLGSSSYSAFSGNYYWVSNNNVPQTPTINDLKSEGLDVTVSWYHVEYAGSYLVEFYNTETRESKTYSVDGRLNSTTQKVGNGNYGVRVIAVNTAGVQSAITAYSYINVNYDFVPVSIRNFDGKIYMLFDVGIPWNEAQEYCETIGGNLATVTSKEENLFIKEFIDNGAKNGYWIGATDELSEGTWTWITDEAFVFCDWYSGNPNNTGTREHYLEMRKDYGYQWNDDSIDKYLATELEKQGFVCEFEEIVFNATVEKNDNEYKVTTSMDNVGISKCIVAGYKNNKLVDIKIISEKHENLSTGLCGDIDEIRVMAWNNLSKFMPICKHIVIANVEK